MEKSDFLKLEKYLQNVFKNNAIRVASRTKKKDSAEVYIGEEFLGVVSEDEDNDDGDKSYFFEMAILDEDLE